MSLSAAVALARAERRLVARLEALEARIAGGDEGAWPLFTEVVAALAAIVPATTPGNSGQLMTTSELAEKLQLSERTIRRHAKQGKLKPVRLGERGRGALRWPAGVGR